MADRLPVPAVFLPPAIDNATASALRDLIQLSTRQAEKINQLASQVEALEEQVAILEQK